MSGVRPTVTRMPDDARRNPAWAWDEIVLACDLVARNDWRGLTANDERVIELSRLLRGLPLHPQSTRLPDFRNANGVARKTVDLATAHPEYQGVPTHGGATDREVLTAFLDRPAELNAEAQSLRAAAVRGQLAELTGPVDEEQDSGQEGRLLIRRHVTRERDPALRSRKISAVLASGSKLACEACGFDFAETYGARGNGYIECHHIIPLHVAGMRSTRLADLALLCANCHRMAHIRPPWPTIAELHTMIEAQRRRFPRP